MAGYSSSGVAAWERSEKEGKGLGEKAALAAGHGGRSCRSALPPERQLAAFPPTAASSWQPEAPPDWTGALNHRPARSGGSMKKQAN